MAFPANWNEISNMDAERWIALANRYLPGVVALIFVVLLGWQLAGLVWMFVPGSPQGDPVSVTPPRSAAPSPAGQSANVQRIASAHLFGEANPDDAVVLPPAQPTEELEETRLALPLKGTSVL